MTRNHRNPGSKGGRAYTHEALRAATHPTRQTILKALQSSDCSTTDLERLTGENRYNLYHHLAFLEQAGLIGHRIQEGRTKGYFLRKSSRPPAAVYQLDRDDAGDRESWQEFLSAVERIAEDPIPDRSRIRHITVVLTYSKAAEG